ncbi:hypothetical protein PFISCL1PPCAC_19239, partial [Pristionchus fissidentatus]
GLDATVPCEALDALSSVHVNQTKVSWRRKTDTDTVKIPYSKPDSKSTERFYTTSHEVLYLLGVQIVHNNTVVECHIEYEPEKTNTFDMSVIQTINATATGTNSTIVTKSEKIVFVSRTRIVVQDCGDEDEIKHSNELNPCMYGICLVDKSTAFHRLQCQCVEQYTGEFCDVLVSGTLWRELLFYSPVLAHLFFFVLFTSYSCCTNATRKVRRTALEDVQEKSFVDKLDMKKLYPSVYFDAHDLEQLTQSDEDESVKVNVVEQPRKPKSEPKPANEPKARSEPMHRIEPKPAGEPKPKSD